MIFRMIIECSKIRRKFIPPMAQEIPFLSIIVPCRNEGAHIRPLLDSLLGFAHPRDKMEIIFVDGMSTDGTKAAVEEAAKAHAFIRVLENSMMTVPYAMNI